MRVDVVVLRRGGNKLAPDIIPGPMRGRLAIHMEPCREQ